MTFRELGPEDDARWNSFVDRAPDGTIFHSTRWLSAIGVPAARFGLFAGDELAAGIVVRETRLGPLRMASNLPLSPYAGVLCGARDGKGVTLRSARKELVGEAASFLQGRFTGVALSMPPSIADVQPFQWAGYRATLRYTYLADLSEVDRCWDEMDPSRRRNIRKAEKDGVEARPEWDPATLLRLVRTTYARQGREPGFLHVARRLCEGLEAGRDGEIIITRGSDGAALAAALIVWDQQRAYYLLGGVDHEQGISTGMAVALWSGMRAAAARGIREFDFEGSSVPAIERFFRKFGGALVPRYEVRWERAALRPLLNARRFLRSRASQ